MSKVIEKMKIKDIQSNLDKLPLIKFKGNEKFKNIEAIIKRALSRNYNIDNSTYYVKNGNKQCRNGAFRGIADLYRLCKYYLPKTKLKELVDYLKNNKMNRAYCKETNQDVFFNFGIEIINSFSTEIKIDKNNPLIRLKNRKKVYIES